MKPNIDSKADALPVILQADEMKEAINVLRHFSENEQQYWLYQQRLEAEHLAATQQKAVERAKEEIKQAQQEKKQAEQETKRKAEEAERERQEKGRLLVDASETGWNRPERIVECNRFRQHASFCLLTKLLTKFI